MTLIDLRLLYATEKVFNQAIQHSFELEQSEALAGALRRSQSRQEAKKEANRKREVTVVYTRAEIMFERAVKFIAYSGGFKFRFSLPDTLDVDDIRTLVLSGMPLSKAGVDSTDLKKLDGITRDTERLEKQLENAEVFIQDLVDRLKEKSADFSKAENSLSSFVDLVERLRTQSTEDQKTINDLRLELKEKRKRGYQYRAQCQFAQLVLNFVFGFLSCFLLVIFITRSGTVTFTLL